MINLPLSNRRPRWIENPLNDTQRIDSIVRALFEII
jgi:hypothetical protein